MNRHQRRLRAKAKPVRLAPPESDNYKVLRVLLTQMPLIQQFAALEQIDVLEAADGMIELIENGLFRLLVRPDGEYELVETRAAKLAVGRRAVRGRRGRQQDCGGSGSAGPWRGGAVSSGLGFRAI
jgi:hypothetical protein